MAADPSMRALLERDRGLLRWIVTTAPAAFWVAARDLRIDKDRVIVPGGAAAEPIWEALVEVKVTQARRFPARAAGQGLGPAGVVLRLDRHR